jgi:uncharacterized protein (TIGR00299 family) protein
MILYADMFSGISGDMVLGALIDLGVPADWLESELLKIAHGFRLDARIVYRRHLKAINLFVNVDEKNLVSRDYSQIRELIQNCDISENVKYHSLAAFEKIALAESRIHGMDLEKLHFHEIGGIDSIVDIVGTFLAMEYLGIEEIYGSCIALGSGTVTCAHGTIPVPVPAVVKILKDVPVKSSDAETEIVTPTGAALITEMACRFGPMPEMIIKKTGYGAGKRNTGSKLPNLLRLIMGEKIPATDSADSPGHGQSAVNREVIHVMETSIDDMNPEFFGFLMHLLFENNALDVCYIPVQMKKNRPGTRVEVLCRKPDLDNLVSLILTQTSATGVRHYECERFFLLRQSVCVETSLGRVQAKQIINPDNTMRLVPEYESVKQIGEKYGMPLKDVYARVLYEANFRKTSCP